MIANEYETFYIESLLYHFAKNVFVSSYNHINVRNVGHVRTWNSLDISESLLSETAIHWRSKQDKYVQYAYLSPLSIDVFRLALAFSSILFRSPIVQIYYYVYYTDPLFACFHVPLQVMTSDGSTR